MEINLASFSTTLHGTGWRRRPDETESDMVFPSKEVAMRKRLWVVVIVVFVWMTAISAVAQQGRAELRGRVVDAQSGALPGVTIVVTNQEAGTYREVVTSGDGSYFGSPDIKVGRIRG